MVLWDPVQKQENILLEGHRSTFLGQKHKSAIWNRTPPTYTSNLIYMCAGGFRGPKSLNRIELSRFVPELLNFGVSGSLQLWGVGCRGWMDGVGVVGGAPTHVCMHMHTCTHTRTCMCGKHDNFMQMATPIGFGEIPGIPYDVIHACTCVHAHACMCMCVGGILSPPPPPSTHHPNPQGGPLESVKIQ